MNLAVYFCHEKVRGTMRIASLSYLLEGINYRIHFWYISKHDAIKIMKNSDLNEKNGVVIICFILCKKWVKKLIIKETEKEY